jgi:tetratricopeptide (TPR) repeat protein
LERAIQADEKHPDTFKERQAGHLANLARCRAETGRIEEARSLFERALAISEESAGVDDKCVKCTLIPIGDFRRRTGDVAGARAVYSRAIEIDEAQALGSTEAGLRSGARRSRGRRGNLYVARPLFERALAIFDQKLITDTPRYASALLKYSSCLLRDAEAEASLDAALRGGEISRRYLRSTLANLPERQALGLIAKAAPGVDQALSAAVAVSEPQATAKALDALVRSRALVLDEIAQRHHTAWLAHDQGPGLVDAYVAASVRLANLTVQERTRPFGQYIEASSSRAAKRRGALGTQRRVPGSEARSQAGLVTSLSPSSQRALVSYVRYRCNAPVPGASLRRRWTPTRLFAPLEPSRRCPRSWDRERLTGTWPTSPAWLRRPRRAAQW